MSNTIISIISIRKYFKCQNKFIPFPSLLPLIVVDFQSRLDSAVPVMPFLALSLLLEREESAVPVIEFSALCLLLEREGSNQSMWQLLTTLVIERQWGREDGGHHVGCAGRKWGRPGRTHSCERGRRAAEGRKLHTTKSSRLAQLKAWISACCVFFSCYVSLAHSPINFATVPISYGLLFTVNSVGLYVCMIASHKFLILCSFFFFFFFFVVVFIFFFFFFSTDRINSVNLSSS